VAIARVLRIGGEGACADPVDYPTAAVEWGGPGDTGEVGPPSDDGPRVRLVLECAAGRGPLSGPRAALTQQTVGTCRNRFVTKLLVGFLDEPWPGGSRIVIDAAMERVVTLTMEPRDATHWRARAMIHQRGLRQRTICRTWRALSLQPHRSETFQRSPDPLFIDKRRDIAGLSLTPAPIGRGRGPAVDTVHAAAYH
jgi:hypothetical protein